MGRRISVSLVGYEWRQDTLLDLFEASKIKAFLSVPWVLMKTMSYFQSH